MRAGDERPELAGINRPREAADRPAKRTGARIDRLIRRELDQLGYTELSTEKSQVRRFETHRLTRVGQRHVLPGLSSVRRGHPEFRGKGHAAAVTAEWADLIRASARLLFYSTSGTNRSSQRVAARLGLRRIGYLWQLQSINRAAGTTNACTSRTADD